MLGGDFNTYRSVEESFNIKNIHWAQLAEFNMVISDLQLIEPNYSGNSFSWTNNRMGAENRKAKLDRVLWNLDWVANFNQNAHIGEFHSLGSRPYPNFISPFF
jgi:hypothetical protein